MVPKKTTKIERPCTCSCNRLRDLDVAKELTTVKKRLKSKSKLEITTAKKPRKFVVSKKLTDEVRKTQRAKIEKVKARFL